MTERAARRHPSAARLVLHVLALALAWAAATHAADPPSDPEALAGVPDSVIGRIIDVTTLHAERQFYTAPDVASIPAHVIHQPKEMPWHHAYVRGGQRRIAALLAEAPRPSAVAEVEPNSAGFLRYSVRLAGRGAATHGLLRAEGLSGSDDYTQGRGSRTETSLTSAGGWRGRGARADVAASWTATSLNRTAPDASLRPFDRAAVDIRASGSFGPPRHRDRTRFALDFSDYAVRPSGGTGGSEDGVTQAMASLQFDLGADVTPLTLSALGVGRRADGADAEGSVDTSLARVGLADRYSRALGGVVDWQLSVAAYTEPDVGDASGTQVAAPLEVGWTMQAGPMGLRVHGGYDIALPPTALYAEADHVGVNTGLPARTAWGGGASLWARVGSALLTGRVDAEDVTGLPVWVEAAPDARDDIAWRPEPADARLVSWKAGVAVPRGSHATFAVEIAGEVADPSDDAWLHLPYRPSLRGRGRATFDVRGGVTVDLSAEHVGERYRIATEADRLAAYTRFGGRVAKMLTPAISVFVSAKATAGTYQTFESRHGSALHALDQGGVGVGLTGRI